MKFTSQQANQLIQWYIKNKRSFPWRDTGNPYDVWLSEIMLQQTRIAVVYDRFLSFKKALPTISSLANCSDERLMKLWEGLGYYSRAQNLKRAAIVICEKYNGQFPKDYAKIFALNGIGSYTAGAICSIAFDLPYPAVDGNVLRVLARLFNDDRNVLDDKVKKEYQASIQSVMIENQSVNRFCSNLTQGLMELGEIVCLPNATPVCKKCPLSSFCISRKAGTSKQLPVRKKPNKKVIEKKTVLVFRYKTNVYVQKRPKKGLLANLYEFPSLQGHLSQKELQTYMQNNSLHIHAITALPSYTHTFSHKQWVMHTFEIVLSSTFNPLENGRFLSFKELKILAIPSAFRYILNYYDANPVKA